MPWPWLVSSVRSHAASQLLPGNASNCKGSRPARTLSRVASVWLKILLIRARPD